MTLFIVEGPGDRDSVPLMLAATIGRRVLLHCIPLGGKSNIVRVEDGFEKTIKRNVGDSVDSYCVLMDDDVVFPPYSTKEEEHLGMHERAARLEADVVKPVRVFWATREFESWLIGGLTRGFSGCGMEIANRPLPGDTQGYPNDPKEWLQERHTGALTETQLQVCLSRVIDWGRARKRNKSLREFLRGVQPLLRCDGDR